MSRNTPTKVCHVSSAHRWSDNRVHLREAASIADAGYDVTLVAVEHDIEVPPTGVKIVTIPQRARLARLILGSAHALVLALRSKARVVHLHDPELIWGIPLLRLMGKVVVYDAHEDLPTQVMDKHYLDPRTRRLVAIIAKILVRLAATSDGIVTATETIAERFPPEKTVVVHNYPRLRAEDEGAPPVLRRDKIIGYVGAMSEERGTLQMIDSFASTAFPEGWSVEIAGSASPASLLENLTARPGWQRVLFHGTVGPGVARDLLLRCRLGMVLFQRNDAHLDSLPTKMFEYLAAGVPVIASDFPLWRDILEEHQCGLVVDETDPDAIAQAIARYAANVDLLTLHSRNALRVARDILNWDSEEKALLGAYEAVLG